MFPFITCDSQGNKICLIKKDGLYSRSSRDNLAHATMTEKDKEDEILWLKVKVIRKQKSQFQGNEAVSNSL